MSLLSIHQQRDFTQSHYARSLGRGLGAGLKHCRGSSSGISGMPGRAPQDNGCSNRWIFRQSRDSRTADPCRTLVEVRGDILVDMHNVRIEPADTHPVP